VFSRVPFSLVHDLASHHVPFSEKFKMAAEKTGRNSKTVSAAITGGTKVVILMFS
jgi:hypothetical protein